MGYSPPQLEVRKVTGGWNIYPPDNTTTDDLWIYANTTDATPYIKLNGAGGISAVLPTGTTQSFSIVDGAMVLFKVYYTSPDTVIENLVDAKNIYLKTTGTGVVKFGTYTAGAATDSTGYITILDAAGNTRKLMVQA